MSSGKALGINITKPSTGWNNAAVPTKSNQNNEKITPHSSLADKDDVWLGTSK
jgi:hypothetical protein